MKHPSAWSILGPLITPQLSSDDDPRAWEVIATSVYSDAELLIRGVAPSVAIRTEFGRCSHWCRPHQTRWTADGGFAWPTGYGGTAYSETGLPEFDWSVEATWDADCQSWRATPERDRAKVAALRFRVAVPSRTARHEQAAVHTLWRPGPPQHRRQELLQFYGFRRHEGLWAASAYLARPRDKAYDRAAETASPADAMNRLPSGR